MTNPRTLILIGNRLGISVAQLYLASKGSLDSDDFGLKQWEKEDPVLTADIVKRSAVMQARCQWGQLNAIMDGIAEDPRSTPDAALMFTSALAGIIQTYRDIGLKASEDAGLIAIMAEDDSQQALKEHLQKGEEVLMVVGDSAGGNADFQAYMKAHPEASFTDALAAVGVTSDNVVPMDKKRLH